MDLDSTVMGLDVSVVIRTRDIERHLLELLSSLASQTLRPSEIIVVNNFSSQRSLNGMMDLLRYAKRRLLGDIQVKIALIPDGEFSYAYSANLGVWAARSELVCLTNGHCLPISERWLESGVMHFTDQDVAGVSGYILPHDYGSVWEKLGFDILWRRLKEKSGAYMRDSFFATTNCILRRSLWMEYPFDERMPEIIENAGRFGGEDYDWALEMLARGYKLIVEPKFDVYHSHRDSLLRLASKYMAWRRIRQSIRSLRRPRRSYTKLSRSNPVIHKL